MFRLLLSAALAIALVGGCASAKVETTVSGRVTNYDDGAPIAGADVHIQTVNATTGDDGQYFVARLTPGRATLLINRRGFQTYRREIDLRPGDNRHDVELMRR